MKVSWKKVTAYKALLISSKKNENHPAVITPDKCITYKELLENSTKLASRLKCLGIGKTDRVATIMEPTIDWIYLKYALSKLGSVIVPLNSRLTAEELELLLYQIKAKALLLIPGEKNKHLTSKLLEILISNKTKNDWLLSDLQFIFTEQGDCSSPIISNFSALSEFPANTNSILDIEHEDCKPGDIEAIIFTSGSTNRPKGAMLNHANITGHAHYLSQFLNIQPDDRYLNLLPFYHIAGFAQSIRMIHYAGSTIYLPEDFSANSICKNIQNNKITVSAGMPITIFKILNFAKVHDVDISSLIKLHGISSDVHFRLMDETKINFISRMYGLTESAGLVSMHTIDRNENFPSDDFIGYPLPGVHVQIHDPLTGQPVPVGEVGEIVFKGWNLFQGYFYDPENTEKSFSGDNFFKTGDRGYLDKNWGLHFQGRYKDMIKTGGENVSSIEIEQFLSNNIKAINTVFVVGVPDPRWGEVITAIIELKSGYKWNPNEYLQICKSNLAGFKTPKYFLEIKSNDWPLRGSGKIDKQSLSQWASKKVKEIENE